MLQAGLRGFILPQDLVPLSSIFWFLARVGGRGHAFPVLFLCRVPLALRG